jgi:plasmid stabilization system protein ParE
MAGKLSWTSLAHRQLAEEIEYLKPRSPEAAAELVRAVKKAEDAIERWPESGNIVLDLDDPDVREVLVAERYRLMFRVLDTGPRVYLFLHSARDHRPFLRRLRGG